MKKIGILILVVAVGILAGCSDDDSSNEPLYGDFGIAFKDEAQPLGYVVKLDDGDHIIPISPSYLTNDWEDSSRVLVYFEVEQQVADIGGSDTYEVNVVEWKDILMKDIFNISPATEDSIGNDPIVVKRMWVTDNLLNFELVYYGNNATHMVNLVKQPGEITSAELPIELEIRHNKFNDQELFQYSAYVSFDLTPLEIAGQDSVEFKVSGTNYHANNYSYNGVYNYGN